MILATIALGAIPAGCGGGKAGDEGRNGRQHENSAGDRSPGREPAREAAVRAAAVENAIASDPSASHWELGGEVTLAERTPIATVAADPAKYAGQRVAFEGTVSKVCQASGCRVEVRAEDGSTILASSLD